MLKVGRKYLPPGLKEEILHSFPYRVFSRIRLSQRSIRISCELTTKCNAKCNMCGRDALLRNGRLYATDMEEKIVSAVLKGIKRFCDNGTRVCFAPMGLGEPFLFKGLFELFDRIKTISKRIRIVLVTNGILLGRSFCERIILSGVEEVSISLNCLNAATYRERMGVDKYEEVCKNIERLIAMRSKCGKTKPKIFIQYLDYDQAPALFNENIRQWLRIMRRYDKCYVHPIVNQAGFCAGDGNIHTSKKMYPCIQPLQRIGVRVSGDIYPCDPCFYAGVMRIDSLYLGHIMSDDICELVADRASKRYKIVHSMRQDDYSELPECRKCTTRILQSNCYFKLPWSLKMKGNAWV